MHSIFKIDKSVSIFGECFRLIVDELFDATALAVTWFG